jgi:hypothetical protein
VCCYILEPIFVVSQTGYLGSSRGVTFMRLETVTMQTTDLLELLKGTVELRHVRGGGGEA